MNDLNVCPHCPTCGLSRTLRVRRKGLIQAVIWTRLGYFPWECCGCRKVFLNKNRGKAKRHRHVAPAISAPRVSA